MQIYPKTLRQALRRLGRAPLFTSVAILTLALGIGANTAIFSVIHGALLKPLPFHDPDRLVSLWHKAPGLGSDFVDMSPASYFAYRGENRVFSDVGMWALRQVSVTGVDQPEKVSTIKMSDGVFPILGVQPLYGRTFTAEDNRAGAPATVVLAYDYWQSRFGADPDVVGRTLTLDGLPHEVIGVMRADLRFLDEDPALYLPLPFDLGEVTMDNFSYMGLARLADGVSLEQANADVDRMIPLAVEKFPGGVALSMLEQVGFAANLKPLMWDAVGDVGNVLWVLAGTVGLVLLIACANVANLFLARAEQRRRELALRSALGASRWSLARDLLVESVTLALMAGTAGVFLAGAGLRLLVALGPRDLPRLAEISINTTVLLFTLAVSVFAGLLFGLAPLTRGVGRHLADALRGGARGTSGPGNQRLRHLLVVTQVALALVLLVGSGLMMRSFQALRQVHPGFEAPKEVQTLRISISENEMEDAAAVALAFEQIQRKLEQIPGVESVGASSSVTMDGWASDNTRRRCHFSRGGGRFAANSSQQVGDARLFRSDAQPAVGRPHDHLGRSARATTGGGGDGGLRAPILGQPGRRPGPADPTRLG